MYYKPQQPAISTEELLRGFGKTLPTQLMVVLGAIISLQGPGKLSGYGCGALDGHGHSLQTSTALGRIRIGIASRPNSEDLFTPTGSRGIAFRLDLFLEARRVDIVWADPCMELLNKILAIYGGYLTCEVADNAFMVFLGGTHTRLAIDIKVRK